VLDRYAAHAREAPKLSGAAGGMRRGSEAVGEPLMLTLAPVDPSLPEAQALLWEYFDELVSRYNDRPGSPEEIRESMVEDPSDDLVGATGVFIIAYEDADPVGCIGLRFRARNVGQVTRMFVTQQRRRRGVGSALLSEVEALARRHGVTQLKLDTRDDLVEARQLYARAGFREVPAFNAGRYAEHWFAKALN
jgi:GNAT superfamily N-acetyltransferase